jgi:hypothetical protein
MYLIGTSILGQIGAAAVLYGAVAALGAIFAGPSKPAVWLRQRLAPTLNEHQGYVWGAVGFVYVLLILWGGTHALRQWWGILLLGGLLAYGVIALRRETLKEFPSGAAAAAAPVSPGVSATDELERLTALHKSGAINDDEFEAAKKAALT